MAQEPGCFCHLNRQTLIILYLTTTFGFALSKKAIKNFIRNQRGELLPDRSSRGNEQQMKHVYVEVCYREPFSVAVLSHFKSPKNEPSEAKEHCFANVLPCPSQQSRRKAELSPATNTWSRKRTKETLLSLKCSKA